MQFSIVAVSALLAGLVSAQGQGFAGLPECAKACAANSLPPECNLDLPCICENASFITGISCCVFNACSVADQEKALATAQDLCMDTKAQLPQSAGCSSGASSSAPTATGSSSSAGVTPSANAASTTSAAAATPTTSNPANKMAAGGVGLAGVILGAAALL